MGALRVYVSKYNPLWDHSIMRIRDFTKKATKDGIYDREKFIKLMVGRLRKITNEEKLHYTIAALQHLGATEDTDEKTGYQTVLDIYDNKITANILTRGWSDIT